jgi:hypothetical protein
MKPMKMTFHEYIGKAGDEHVLLIGVTEDGRRETELYNRMYFKNFNRRRAEKRIAKKLAMTEVIFAKRRFRF